MPPSNKCLQPPSSGAVVSSFTAGGEGQRTALRLSSSLNGRLVCKWSSLFKSQMPITIPSCLPFSHPQSDSPHGCIVTIDPTRLPPSSPCRPGKVTGSAPSQPSRGQNCTVRLPRAPSHGCLKRLHGAFTPSWPGHRVFAARSATVPASRPDQSFSSRRQMMQALPSPQIPCSATPGHAQGCHHSPSMQNTCSKQQIQIGGARLRWSRAHTDIHLVRHHPDRTCPDGPIRRRLPFLPA